MEHAHVSKNEVSSATEEAARTPEMPLPPGTLGLPVIGETLAFLRSPKTFLQERRDRHGDVFKTSLFGSKMVFALGPDAHRWIFSAEGKVLENQWPPTIRRLLGDTVVARLNGKAHKQRRKLLAPHFTRAAAARFVPRVRAIAGPHLEAWADQTGPVHVYDRMRALAFDIAMALLFGGSRDVDAAFLRTRFAHYGDGMFAVVPLAVPGTSFARAVKAKHELFEYLQEIVRERQKLAEQPDDVLGSLIECRTDAGEPLSVEDIVHEAKLQLWAGHDTTVNAMSNLMLLLAQHPDALASAREEQDAAPAEPGADELEKMPRLNQVINEGMRCVPPVAGAFRRVIDDTSYAGYRIPRGWVVGLSILGAARDRLWSNPERFDPERWCPHRAEHEQAQFTAIPFGGGPRVCVGQHFAMAEMRTVVALLLRSYQWRLIPGQDLDYLALPFPRPRSGILVDFQRRTSA